MHPRAPIFTVSCVEAKALETKKPCPGYLQFDNTRLFVELHSDGFLASI